MHKYTTRTHNAHDMRAMLLFGRVQVAWAHLARESPCCIAFLDGGAIDPAVAERLGLPRDKQT